MAKIGYKMGAYGGDGQSYHQQLAQDNLEKIINMSKRVLIEW